MWQIKGFESLSTDELFDILKERLAVFVVEQKCPYPEIDQDDKKAIHIFARADNGVVKAYCRLIPEQDVVKLGRVLVNQDFRKEGFGRILVQKALSYCQENFPEKPIFAQAQAYLESFYASFGFATTSDIYLEDHIPHIDMIKKE